MQRSRVQAGVGFLQSVSLGGDVAVMEAEVVDVQLVHQFEGCISLVLCNFHGIGSIVVLSQSANTEHVGTFCAHGVPVGHGEAQMLAHGLSCNDLLGVIIAECEGGLGVLALVFDLVDTFEEFHSLSNHSLHMVQHNSILFYYMYLDKVCQKVNK